MIGFLPTTTIMTALQTALQAIQYQGNPLFDPKAVKFFDMTDIVVALQELLTYQKRACFIVHDTEHFENTRAGQELRIKQRMEITLLVADRHFANRQIALMGDGGETPGALTIHDLILGAIAGLLIPGAYIAPITGQQTILQGKVRDQVQGRVAYSMVLRISSGIVIKNLGQQPIPE